MKPWIKISLVAILVLSAPYWLMAIFIGGASIYGKVDKVRYAPTTEFTSDRWQKPNRKYRFSVLDKVATQIVTNGMAEASVSHILGKPDIIDTNGNWQFETQRPGWRFIDFSGGGLLIEFDSERRVQHVSINTWID
jgi:hypothetical protein